ncbi:MAG: TIGR01212 family radical SAM protein [Lachnospiraceae bacterium]|nr:TIGR01212 family radical SAM protein [Lachnospiraceae bacterium]
MRMIGDVLKEEYGCKVYKLSLSAKVTCPNRDGTLGTRGCIFCSKGGSGEFASNADLPLKDQIEEGKRRLSGKVKGDGKYIAYFQSFTNTYGDPSYLKALFEEALSYDDIVILSVATRPDCISDEILNILKKINAEKPVWVELGLQTIHKKSSDYIRRGYELKIYDQAVTRLKNAGISPITHLILGLPGESVKDMEESLKYVVNSGAEGIKLQLLHILKDTDLEKEYLAGRVRVMEMEEYLDLLSCLIPLIPEDMVIHRLTGDGDKRSLLAPLWTGDKKRVWNAIKKRFIDKTQ